MPHLKSQIHLMRKNIHHPRMAAFLSLPHPFSEEEEDLKENSLFNEDTEMHPAQGKPQRRDLSDRRDSRAKNDNTLGALTRKFVSLIQSQPEKVIEISMVSRELGIQKRRIYDITNVLEGIGYIEKIEKNKMKWVGGTSDTMMEEAVQELDATISRYDERCRGLDEDMEKIREQLKAESKVSQHLNYLTNNDMRSILRRMNAIRMLVVLGNEGTVVNANLNPETNSSEINVEGEAQKMLGIYVISHAREDVTEPPIQKAKDAVRTIKRSPNFNNKVNGEEKDEEGKGGFF